MLSKSDHIDLNSDAVSVDGETEVHGDYNVSVTETLTDGSAQVQGCSMDSVVGEDRVFDVNTRRNEDLESVDGGRIDVKGDCSMELDVGTHKENMSMEEIKVNSSPILGDKIESTNFDTSNISMEDAEGGGVELDSSSGFEGRMESKVVDASGLIHSVDVSAPHKNPNAMDIDNQAEINENQVTGAINDPLTGASNESDELNLVVDLHTYVGDGGDKSRDMDAEMTASKPGFCVSDLVWGKVRSHPWWPGQIFDASAASVKAKKYFKKDGYLIAYFGDQTFAWNEASRIKPFRPHFSQMEKQSSSPDFHYAVSCALEEVSRRVELGLACSCISEEVYAKIKTQIIVNAGIREESSRREVGDIFSSAASFEPVKPIGFIKELARQPLGGVDKMEFTTAHAQLQAFYLWKGYTQLPEVKMLGGLLESDEDIPLLSEVKHGDKLTEDASPGLKNDEVTENVAPGLKNIEVIQNASPGLNNDEQLLSEKGKLKSQDGSSGKRKHISGNSMHPSKKEKSLLELMAERRSSVSNGKKGSDSKTGCKLISSYSGKKRKLVESISDDYVEKLWKGQVSLGTDKSSQVKQTFRVGNSILKVASQLNGGSPVLKNSAEIAQKTAVNRSKEKSLSRRSQGENHLTSENSSDEILSQLFLAARDPMRKHSFLISIVSFFSKFRNSVSLDPSGARDHEQSSAPMVGGDMGENLNWLENTEASELDNVRESYCTDRILVSVPEGQLSPKNQNEGGEKSNKLENTEASDLDHVQDLASVPEGQLSPKNQNEGGEKSNKLENTEASELDHVQDLASMPEGQLSPKNQNEGGEKSSKLENSEASELDHVQDLASVPEGQLSPKNQNEGGEFQPETPSEKGVLVSETQAAIQLSPTTDFERKIVGGNQNLEAGKPVGHLENSQDEETSPTALILNFTDLDSVPSETNLNSIFSRYGPLNESETEVLKKSSRAKVVFKRRADAETAFSSAGKYSTFGPSLVSYRLRYMPSTPSKASPNPKRSRKDATPVERNAT